MLRFHLYVNWKHVHSRQFSGLRLGLKHKSKAIQSQRQSQPKQSVQIGRVIWAVSCQQHHYQHCKRFSTKAPSTTAEDGIESEEGFPETEIELDSEFGMIVGTGAEDEHFRINLYPSSNDPVLSSIHEATSVAQVFEIIEAIEPSLKNAKHTSQALVSIWDLQKYLYKIGPIFDPQRDFSNRNTFVEHLSKHPNFNEICQHVTTHVGLLDDEPLVASLLCLKRMNWSMRDPECQVFIEECIKRKASLSLPALSRLCVCMKTEGIYGSLVLLEFLPLVTKFVREMDDDISVRLVSICLRSMHRALPPSTMELYREKLSSILSIDFQSVTYCKILLCLQDTRYITTKTDRHSPQQLLREVGMLATPQVAQMELMEVLSLQRVLESGPHEPVKFIEAIYKRVSRFIEEQEDTPRLDLIACISPFIRRSTEQKRRLAAYVHEYLDSYENFDQISQILLKILKVVKLKDKALYDKYWTKAAQLISMDSMNTRACLRLINDYLSFNFGVGHSYRHDQFENHAKRLLYFYLENYRSQTQPCVVSPGDFAKIYAFLIAFGNPHEPIFQEQSYGHFNSFDTNFAFQCRVQELGSLARGVATSLIFNGNSDRSPKKYFDQIMNFCSVLEETVSYKLLGDHGEELNTSDLVSISKLHLTIKRAFGDSPVFQESVSRWAESCTPQTLDSKQGRDMSLTLIAANYNEPAVLDVLKEFILKNSESVTPDMVAKFLCLSYSLGFEPDATEDANCVFSTCYDILERHWEQLGALTLLQASLALIYFRSLQSPLVHNIFSAHFLDEVDQELSTLMSHGSFPLKVRNAFMELNRAVCLDLPSANVPWFHKKFCEDIISTSNLQEDYFQVEVKNILSEVVGDSTAIQKNVYSPYFYLINFVIEFDKKGNPIKKSKKPHRLFSLPKLKLSYSEELVEIGERVAILILPKFAFTKNVRSLKGFYKLRIRHLEMLGYRVVLIDPQHWNSMYMSEKYAKNDFLENSIFSKQAKSSDKINLV